MLINLRSGKVLQGIKRLALVNGQFVATTRGNQAVRISPAEFLSCEDIADKTSKNNLVIFHDKTLGRVAPAKK